MSTHDVASKLPNSVQFDMDSFSIGINSFVSACMYPNKEHFTSYKEESGHECKGIASGLNIAVWGTLNFKIDDDNGRTYNIYVLDAVHIPDLLLVMLSPLALGTKFDHWNDGDNRCDANGAPFSQLCEDDSYEPPYQHPKLQLYTRYPSMPRVFRHHQ